MRTRLLGGRYRLGPVIGVGGMGAVHRARDERLGRDVAVKVLRAGAAAADCVRLRREVEYLGTVHHPNLVAVLDGGADGTGGGSEGVTWFAMELVAGPDLRTLLQERGPLEGEAVRRLLTGVLGALGAMHAAGLVHRDVTPSNILLTADPFARWEAKLTDLGIARRILSVPLTDAGRVVGTAAYLSPEQVLGGEVGPATDVYALALVAVEALTGVHPFPGSAVESATSRLLRPPALPGDLAPEWRRLLLAATSVDPAERPDVATFRAAVIALPEDSGVRPDRTGLSAAGAATDADAERSTAVLPAGPPITAVMRAADRTAEMATVQRRGSRSRVAVALAASAAIVGGLAIVGSAALVGSHLLTAAAVEHVASTSAPRQSSTASATAPTEGATRAAPADSDASQTDTTTDQPDPAAPPEEAGPAADRAAPRAGAAAPGGGPDRSATEAEGPGAAPGDPAAVVGPNAP